MLFRPAPLGLCTPKRRLSFPFFAMALPAALLLYALADAHPAIALAPYPKLLRLLYGLSFELLPDGTYAAVQLPLLITASCSGAKWLVAACCMLTFGFPRFTLPPGRQLLCALGRLGVCLPLALLVSLLRMALSLPFCTLPQGQLIHNILSLFLFFLGLGGLYLICAHREKTHSPRRDHP